MIRTRPAARSACRLSARTTSCCKPWHGPSRRPVSLGAGQRGEQVGEDAVGPGVQLVVGQQLDWMWDVDQAGARHAEPTCLLDGFVGEWCCRDSDRRDAPAL